MLIKIRESNYFVQDSNIDIAIKIPLIPNANKWKLIWTCDTTEVQN